MTIDERREKVLHILRRRNRYQFGQPPETCNLVTNDFPGDVGCMDTSIQVAVWMALDKKVSLNQVRRASGNAAHRPMQIQNALRALHHFGLPYEIRTNLGARGAMRLVLERGPIIICELYWAHPQWKDYRYLGKTMNGWDRNSNGNLVRPGFARPLERAGKNQWDFREGHGVMLATSMKIDGEPVGIVRDPNHNSPSRPERPAYDVVTARQLDRMFESWPGSRMLLVPTRVVVK